jgi:hypothetical protein
MKLSEDISNTSMGCPSILGVRIQHMEETPIMTSQVYNNRNQCINVRLAYAMLSTGGGQQGAQTFCAMM